MAGEERVKFIGFSLILCHKIIMTHLNWAIYSKHNSVYVWAVCAQHFVIKQLVVEYSVWELESLWKQ